MKSVARGMVGYSYHQAAVRREIWGKDEWRSSDQRRTLEAERVREEKTWVERRKKAQRTR